MAFNFNLQVKDVDNLYTIDQEVNKGKVKFDGVDVDDFTLTATEEWQFLQVTIEVIMMQRDKITYHVEESDKFSADKTQFSTSMTQIFEDMGDPSGSMYMAGMLTVTMEDRVSGGGGQEYVTNILNIYKMDYNQLLRFNSIRWHEDFNHDQLVYNLFMFPMDLEGEGLSGDIEEIKFGDIGTGIECPLFGDDKVLIDGGTVKVPHKYNNLFDYKDTLCTVYAPYVDGFDIDVDYVIDRELNFMYSLDLANGDVKFYVRDVESDSILIKKNVDMVRHVPFVKWDFTQSGNDIGTYVYNDVWTPYIEVRRSKPVGDTSCINGYKNVQCGLVGEFEGYVRFSDVKVETDATEVEKDTIRTKLLDGIYIK